jgi:hypothetical protein
MKTMPRFTRYIVTLVTLALCLAAAATASAQSPSVSQLDPYQWDLGTTAPQTSNDNTTPHMYAFHNLRNNSYLDGHHRTFGVDLDWGDGTHVTSGLRYWSFVRKDGSVGPIQPNERVALVSNFTHQYLMHGSEHFGIQLAWRKYASYEWQVTVKNGRVAIYNSDAGDYIVYGTRSFGVDLNWLSSVAKQAGATVPQNRTASVFLRAQPPVSGYVPFFGTFGGGATSFPGTLQSVSNPNGNVALLFVKPGFSTSDCGNSSDVVYLGPGQTMTADQRTAAFGGATPMLPASFVTCAVASNSITQIPINIVYYGLA